MSDITLRWYQTGAIDALWAALRGGVPSPVACLPTGAGKSVVVSSICKSAVQNWNGRVLVLVHVKELVQQLADAVRRDWGGPMCPIGVLSAGLGSRAIDQITVAGIQTAFRRSTEIGPRDIIIIDEAHLIPETGDGMYRTLISELRILNPKVRILGLTATPYRLGNGLIYGDGKVFSDLIYDAGIKRLIEEGFLCRLRSKDGGAPDLGNVHMRGGEFIASELETAMSDEDKVQHAADEMMRFGADRRAWLVFCCGVAHAALVSSALSQRGVDNAVLTGETPDDERDAIIARYKARELRCLVNINVLTTGFDAPHVDLIAMLRPTTSAGLYYQQMGRGLRIHPEKADCLILDCAGNIQRHGPIDQIMQRIVEPKIKDGPGHAPIKTCPQCKEMVFAGLAICTECFFVFPPREIAKHDTVADPTSPISGDDPPAAEPYWVDITAVNYEPWTKKGADETAPKTMCVTYYKGMQRAAREWVCVEHPLGGFAHNKAMDWMRKRVIAPSRILLSDDRSCMVLESPDGEAVLNAGSAAHAGLTGLLSSPTRIQLKPDGKFTAVTAHDFDSTPATMQRRNDATMPPDDEEPPF